MNQFDKYQSSLPTNLITYSINTASDDYPNGYVEMLDKFLLSEGFPLETDNSGLTDVVYKEYMASPKIVTDKDWDILWKKIRTKFDDLEMEFDKSDIGQDVYDDERLGADYVDNYATLSLSLT